MVNFLTAPVFQPLAEDANGNLVPLPGGKVYGYQAGTTTPQQFYAADGVTPIANPVILDAEGKAVIALGQNPYKVKVTTAADAVVSPYPMDNVQAPTTPSTIIGNALAALAADNGATLVGRKIPGTGGIATTVEETLERIIHLNDFLSAAQKADIAAGTASLDCQVALNNAVAVAHAMASHWTPLSNPAGPPAAAGVVIQLPAGIILLASSITVSAGVLTPVTASCVLYDGVILRGMGVQNTILYSNTNACIVANAQEHYGTSGMGVQDLTIKGGAAVSATLINQVGLMLNRDWWGNVHDVVIRECGSLGMWCRECLNTMIERCSFMFNQWDGLRIDMGVSATYPSLNLVLSNNFYAFNRGFGLNLMGAHSAIMIRSGAAQNNTAVYGGITRSHTIVYQGTTDFTLYGAASNAIGTVFTPTGAWPGTGLANSNQPGVFQVEISGNSYQPAEFTDFWVEGVSDSFIHVNMDGELAPVRFVRLHHNGAGPTGNTNRCIINDKGAVYLEDCFGSGNLYAFIPAVTGAMCSFSGTTMTLNTAATAGTLSLGQTLNNAGSPAANGVTVQRLLTGTIGAVGSTYQVSANLGTIANSATTFGSTSPFQVNVGAAVASFRAAGLYGTAMGDAGPWFCSEAGAVQGLFAQVHLDNPSYHFGDQAWVGSTNGQDQSWRQDGDLFARMQIDSYNKRMEFGDGSAAPIGWGMPLQLGAPVASAATITPTGGIFHVTGSAAIATINPPFSGFKGSIILIPDAAFTTTTAGNIALASTGVLNKALEMVYDGTKWYPSY